MKLTATTLFALIWLLLAAHTTLAKDTWTSVRSQNFFLVGNAPEKDIRQVATRLEQFRDAFTRLIPNANFKTPVPTTVVVFKSDGSYKPFKPIVNGKPLEIAGYFQSGEDVNYITLTTERRAENPYSTIYHEYTHLLVNNTLGKIAVPPWFNEGLAEYYSTFEVSEDRKVLLGNLIDNHLLFLRQQKLIPLKQLFDVDYYSLERNKHETRSLFYAESWALVHYLILGNDGKRLPQLGRFIDLRGKGATTEKAFTEAFQTDIASMEKELKDYIQRHTFSGQVATFKQKLEFDSGMQAAPMTEAEANAYLGDLLAHINRPSDAVAYLEQSLRLNPKLSMAHASLGTLLARQKRFDEAKSHLREAIAAGAESYLAHYYYAYALSREGMDEAGHANGYPASAAREMREHLLKAIELKPDFPESYHLLAFTDLVMNENLDEGVKMLGRARALAPGNEHYALILAQIYLRQENFDAARKTVEPLTRDTSEPQLRSMAQSILNSIQTMQEQSARIKAMNEAAANATGDTTQAPRLVRRSDSDAGDTSSERSGKSEEQIVAEAMSSAISEALRKPLDGEMRARGTLTHIECSAKGMVFIIKVGARLLRLSAKNYDGLQIMAYTNEAGSELSCGPRKVESHAVVTYRSAPDGRAKTDGALIALEFVPATFQLKQ